MLDVMMRRRSIRKYRRDPVPREMILDMLKGAMYAPSASNRQPWHFVVIEDRRMLEEVPGFHPHAAMVPDAAGCIAVCADTTVSHGEMWVQDCAAATQNILLMAESLGLGAVWLGIHPREDRIAGFRSFIHLPGGIEPFSLVAFGWPGEKPPMPERWDEAKIHWNGW
jgi:nitroreductase